MSLAQTALRCWHRQIARCKLRDDSQDIVDGAKEDQSQNRPSASNQEQQTATPDYSSMYEAINLIGNPTLLVALKQFYNLP